MKRSSQAQTPSPNPTPSHTTEVTPRSRALRHMNSSVASTNPTRNSPTPVIPKR